jgi:opacity protein-like surface antigen
MSPSFLRVKMMCFNQLISNHHGDSIMKQLLLVLLVVAVAANMAFAGSPMTNQGDKALSFTLSGLGTFGLGSAPAGGGYTGFGGKYFLSKDMALRGALGFQNWSRTTKVANPTGPGLADYKESQMWFALTPGLEWHFMTGASVSPYWGLQATVALGSMTDTPPSPGVEDKYSATMFGAALFMGAEWFPWDGVSFTGEYQVGFTSSSSKNESAGVSVDGPSTTVISIYNLSVGINVYLGN